MTLGIHNLLVRLINVALAVVAFFLGMNILLRIFGANETTPFVAWIYNVAGTLASPFRGMFPSLAISDSAAFDIVSLIALIAYSILAYLLIALVNMLFHPTDTYVQTDHTHTA